MTCQALELMWSQHDTLDNFVTVVFLTPVRTTFSSSLFMISLASHATSPLETTPGLPHADPTVARLANYLPIQEAIWAPSETIDKSGGQRPLPRNSRHIVREALPAKQPTATLQAPEFEHCPQSSMSQSFFRSSTTLPANTSVTEKRTVITSSSGLGGSGSVSGDGDDDSVYYRSSITPRTSSITPRSHSSLGPPSPIRTGGGTVTRVVEMSSGYHMPSLNSNQTAPAVSSFKTNREKEKKDMQDLNERFANYIEKVRFLEAQNKKLVSELDQLRSHWGKETSAVKQMYETELDEARKLIDDTNKEKARLQLRVGQLEEQLDDAMRQ
ncbi:intermediate filament protein ifa-1 [Plakobranchus ocellatus]|uniref:Intermediate filament protein ifa-1 n=1 Tax=Plakobranchus ocellatus TaxID=259542 RepID=A0AAV3YBB0_9GAST|nr:intermediate filament protein ifa-1 [Plakobranchus ocellatus]